VISGVLDRLVSLSVSDCRGRILHANSEFLRISKYGREELLGQDHRILNSGHHPRSFFKEMYRTIARGKPWRAPIQNKAKDGSLYWVDTLIWPLTAAGEKVVGYLSVRLEITAQVDLHKKLEERNQLLEAVIKEFPGGIAVFDKNLNMVICNDLQKELLDYPDSLFRDGLPSFEQLIRLNAERGEYGSGCIDDQVESRMELARRFEAHRYERVRPNGRHIEVRGAPMDGGGFVSSHIDITERKRNEEMIERLAQFDALTGLVNRSLLRDRMKVAIARCARGDSLAVHHVDLDRFKSVNEVHGHAVGDQLLRAVAERLRRSTRATDTVSRIGADEFVIIQSGARTREDATALARRLISEISRPYDIESRTLEICSSIGIAMSPADTLDPNDLLACADLALRHAKEDGSSTFGFYAAGMAERLHSRRSIENDLRTAVANGQFELHYQPILTASDGRLASFEALLRWRHPKRGLVSPAEFIPIAEETGLMSQIGDWVLDQACTDALEWPETVSVSVNVSVAQFRNTAFVEKIGTACKVIAPSRLLLEITESTLLENDQRTHDALKQIRALGVRFALDDFGTGYSSLSYLQNFPFDSIKIDRCFVSGPSHGHKSQALLAAIADLGRALGMETTAEGIETETQYRMIKQHGCTHAQGYYLSKPLPNTQLAPFIQAHASPR